MNKILNKNSLYIIYFYIIVLADIITKIWNNLNPAPSSVIKGILLVPLFLFFLKKQHKFRIYFLILLCLFSIGCLTRSYEFFTKQIPQFFEYYFFIVFFIFFYSVQWIKIRKALELVFYSHAIVIFIAAIFEIKFFKTYYYSDRYGYISFFNSQNEFSYIMMAGVLFFYTNLKDGIDFLGYSKLLIFIVAGLMVGTKAFFLFIILSSIYLLIIKISIYRSLFVLASIFFVLFIFSNPLLIFFKQNYSDLYVVYKSEGILSLISSQRSVLFWERLQDFWNSNEFLNLIIGGGKMHKVFEMSFLDLFVFFGLIGVYGYLLIIYKEIYRKIIISREIKVILSIIIIISFLSGYLLQNASAQIYLLLVILTVASKSKFLLEESEKRSNENKNAKT